jgi:uncharacterized membrane protein YvlD (DUF360 family)
LDFLTHGLFMIIINVKLFLMFEVSLDYKDTINKYLAKRNLNH